MSGSTADDSGGRGRVSARLRAIDGGARARSGSTVRSTMAAGERTLRAIAANPSDAVAPPSALHFADDFNELRVVYEREESMLWYFMQPQSRPSFTIGLLQEIRALQDGVQRMFAEAPDGAEPDLRYLVLASTMPDIFNLGGDLSLLARMVRAQDRAMLDVYAKACIDVLYRNITALDLPLATISLVQGDALGGGFEAALSGNVIIAEEHARFGLPEVLFNLFPGMGAYSMLARRIGTVEAERMIFSGKIYEAAELHAMGIVDVLAPTGFGENAVYEFVDKQQRRFNAHRAVYQVRRRYLQVTCEELVDIAAIWVDAAMRLTPTDLRKVDRLAKSQDRRQERRVDKS